MVNGIVGFLYSGSESVSVFHVPYSNAMFTKLTNTPFDSDTRPWLKIKKFSPPRHTTCNSEKKKQKRLILSIKKHFDFSISFSLLHDMCLGGEEVYRLTPFLKILILYYFVFSVPSMEKYLLTYCIFWPVLFLGI